MLLSIESVCAGVCVLVDDSLVNVVSLSLYLSVSLSLCLPCVHDMATVSQSPLLFLRPSVDRCVSCPAPPSSSPSPPSLSPPARDTQHQ